MFGCARNVLSPSSRNHFHLRVIRESPVGAMVTVGSNLLVGNEVDGCAVRIVTARNLYANEMV